MKMMKQVVVILSWKQVFYLFNFAYYESHMSKTKVQKISIDLDIFQILNFRLVHGKNGVEMKDFTHIVCISNG